MGIYDDINKALNDELQPINEFKVEHKNTPSCTILDTIENYTIVFVAEHLRARIEQRLKVLSDYGIKIKRSKLYTDIVNQLKKDYNRMLKASQLKVGTFPTIKYTSKICYHVVYRLNNIDTDTISTLDIAVIAQCEPLKWNAIDKKLDSKEKEHEYLVNNITYNYLLNAIKRLNMCLMSPIFTVGTIVTAYDDGMKLNGFSEHKVLEHYTFYERTINVTSQQLEEIKDIVADTKH